MFGFRKKEEELQLALKDLMVNEEILNKIQASLFCGEKLDSETIENYFLELQTVRDNIEEYFNRNANTVKNRVKNDFFETGDYVKRELIYFGIIIIMSVILGPMIYGAVLLLALFKSNKEEEKSKLDILTEKKSKNVSELFNLMMRRIINYEDALKLKQDRLRIENDKENENENMLILANDYLDLYLNDRLTLLDIPVEIQNVLLVMLRQEMNSLEPLEVLLEKVREKRRDNLMVRERNIS